MSVSSDVDIATMLLRILTYISVVTTYASEMEKEKVRYANRLNERAGEHRRKHNSSPSDIYIYPQIAQTI